TKHGLTSKLVVIPGEDPEDFESLKAELAASYQPANAAEDILVTQIDEHFWRLRRARGVETSVYQVYMESCAPPEPAEPAKPLRVSTSRPELTERRRPANETQSAGRCFAEHAARFD